MLVCDSGGGRPDEDSSGRREDIEVRSPVPEELYEEVILHLRENFFSDEPLNKSVGLCPTPGTPHPLLEEHSLNTLRDHLSVVATSNNQVVGVALNGVLERGELEMCLEKLEKIEDEKFKSIFGLLYRTSHSLELFSRYSVEKIFECRILSVDKQHRGKGLAHKLLQLSEQVAANNGFNVLKGDSTGLYSQKILAKLGYTAIHELIYSEHKDQEGRIVFDTQPPHKSLKIMIKLLDKDSND